MHRVKCVLLGESKVGKTSLIISFAYDSFDEDSVPQIFDFKKTLSYQSEEIDLNLWDTSNDQELDDLRPFSYLHTDAFLMCYAIDDEKSFKTIEENILPEIRQLSPDTPVVLIGIKSDLRFKLGENIDNNVDRMKLISYREGVDLAQRIKAVKYMECSPKTGEGVQTVVEEVIRIVTTENKSCLTPSCFVL